jgi:hypothetical protein
MHTDFGITIGVTDDSDAINRAISDQNRCGPWVCDSSTDSPAVVYIPSGTYLIGKPIIFYYMTQLIGDPRNRPVLKAASSLDALALIDASPYSNQNGEPGWISTNIFLRQIRNVVIDGTARDPTKGFQGIHWPASQATTIQNVKIIMTQSDSSTHAGIFVENGMIRSPSSGDKEAYFSRFRWSHGRPRDHWRQVRPEHWQPAIYLAEHQDLQRPNWYFSNLGLGLAILRS